VFLCVFVCVRVCVCVSVNVCVCVCVCACLRMFLVHISWANVFGGSQYFLGGGGSGEGESLGRDQS